VNANHRQIERLIKRRERLKEQINRNLDLLIGSVGKSAAMRQHNLTTKVDGKTVTVYIRNGLVEAVRKMTTRHAKVKQLIAQLSKVNWELLKQESR
jgi:hypothetical protein